MLALFLSDLAIVAAIVAFPPAAAALRRHRQWERPLRLQVEALAGLMIAHFALLEAQLRLILAGDFVLDLHPLDDFIVQTLNWLIPWAAVWGLGAVLANRSRRTPSALASGVGALLLSIALHLWLAHRVFVGYPSIEWLQRAVWWL